MKYRDGTTTAPNCPPKASDYNKEIEGLVNQAVNYFAVKLYTVHAFPHPSTAKEWAQEAWLLTCRKAKRRFEPAGTFRIVTAVSSLFAIRCVASYLYRLRDVRRQFALTSATRSRARL